MRSSTKVVGVAAAIAIVTAAPAAKGEELAKFNCQAVGRVDTFEPAGDRDGHGILASAASCSAASGLLEGGLGTVQGIWEWDKTTGALLTEGGLIRKPDAIVVFQMTEGKIDLTIAEGKVTGFTATGKGRLPFASGGMAAIAGKTFTWTSKSAGFGRYEVIWTAD
jgi:hypothetical protein